MKATTFATFLITILTLASCTNDSKVNPAGVVECNLNTDCSIGGCSSQLCGPKESISEVITTCEYNPIYDCYKETTCGCIHEKCQWIENDAYNTCMQNIE